MTLWKGADVQSVYNAQNKETGVGPGQRHWPNEFQLYREG